MRRNLSFNALRGFAALGILFLHLKFLSETADPVWGFIYNWIFILGAKSASFFFILSGFMLAYTWKGKEFIPFIKDKFKKIYPLYISVFLISLVADFFMKDTFQTQGPLLYCFNIVINVLMLKAFVPVESVFMSFNGLSWFVSVLMGLYIAGYFQKKSISQNLETGRRRTLSICILAYAVEAVICILLKRIDVGFDWYKWLTYINPIFRICGEGFAGILLYEYMPVLQQHFQKIKDFFKNQAVFEWLLLVVIYLSIISIYKIDTYLNNAWSGIFPSALLLIAFYKDEGYLAKFLSWKPFQFLGDISFEIYMTQILSYEGLPVIMKKLLPSVWTVIDGNIGLKLLVIVPAVICVAWIAHYLTRPKRKEVPVC